MPQQTAVIIGSSGLIGEALTSLLLQDDRFSQVRILVRRPVSLRHPKLDIRVVNFDEPDELSAQLGNGDCLFCCVGTTQKKVKGDKQAYRKVDYDIPITTARLGITNGFRQYLLVSAVGANPNSGNFYLQLKGSVEEDLTVLPYQAIHIFRPSLLLGHRQESRTGEKIAQVLMPALSFLLQGPLRKYRAIGARQVAQAMTVAALSGEAGVHVYQYDQIKQLSKNV